MTLFGDYKSISRGALTREGKNATAEKLMRLINDYPVIGLPVVRSLLVFKWVRKKTWSSDLQNRALVDLEGELSLQKQRLQHLVAHKVDQSQYPTMDELMELVVNRSFVAQAAIPATFKGVLSQLTNSQLLFVVSGGGISNELKSFLKSNGIRVNQEKDDGGYDLSFITLKNALANEIMDIQGKLDSAHVDFWLVNEEFIKQVLADLQRYAGFEHVSQNKNTARKLLELFVVDDKEICSRIIEKDTKEAEERLNKKLAPPKRLPVKDRVASERRDFEFLRETFFASIGSSKISSPRSDKPTGRLSAVNSSSQGLISMSHERSGSLVSGISYDEWARFIFIHQGVISFWGAVPLLKAGLALQSRNQPFPQFFVDGDTHYTFITPSSRDNTVIVREVWGFSNIGDSGVNRIRIQMEVVSKFELILSDERRGALPRSFTLRRLEYQIKRFYPDGVAFPIMAGLDSPSF
jgi:hypothetical protein